MPEVVGRHASARVYGSISPMQRTAVLSVALAVTTACGHQTPTSPSTTVGAPSGTTTGASPFPAGVWTAVLLGNQAVCGSTAASPLGPVIGFGITLTANGTGWTGTTSGGTLVMQFEATGSALGLVTQVTGSASGFEDAENISVPGFPTVQNPMRATFTPAVPFSGTATTSPGNSFLGTMNGPVVFTQNGVTTTCPPGSVILSLLPKQ